MKVIMIAVRHVDPISIGPAIIRIYHNSTLKICQSELKADSKISAGRKISKIKWALSEAYT